jgi:signal recognition particle subunit SRP19
MMKCCFNFIFVESSSELQGEASSVRMMQTFRGERTPQLIKRSKSIAEQIEMRKQDKIFLWPVYFDANKTRTDGRRVPKKLAVSAPKLEELQRAAKKLGLQPEVVPDAAHPSSPWRKTGLLAVPKNEPKNETLKKIAENLSKSRR